MNCEARCVMCIFGRNLGWCLKFCLCLLVMWMSICAGEPGFRRVRCCGMVWILWGMAFFVGCRLPMDGVLLGLECIRI